MPNLNKTHLRNFGTIGGLNQRKLHGVFEIASGKLVASSGEKAGVTSPLSLNEVKVLQDDYISKYQTKQ